MPVAPSFQNFEFLTEPYFKDGGNRQYIQVRNPKTGTNREVRFYTEKEFAKQYPEIAAFNQKTKTLKEVLGFDKGYIYIFKGSAEDWLARSEARYHVYWQWYFISTKELPTDLPETLTAAKLLWSSVAENDNKLLPEAKVRRAVWEALNNV